eukprot:425308-Amphidinium_carterae.1
MLNKCYKYRWAFRKASVLVPYRADTCVLRSVELVSPCTTCGIRTQRSVKSELSTWRQILS